MSTGLNDPSRCNWCGSFHAFKCPMVKAVEYHENGTQKRVEFYAPVDYPPLKAVGSVGNSGPNEYSGYLEALFNNPSWPGGHGV